MPIYEYRCTTCEEVFELIHGVSEPAPVASPCCGAPVERQLSVSADHRNQHPRPHGKTCCGRDDRCDSGGSCCGG
jgi:putative FmdB family regulatory protein